jgi:hypothetical protein
MDVILTTYLSNLDESTGLVPLPETEPRTFFLVVSYRCHNHYVEIRTVEIVLGRSIDYRAILGTVSLISRMIQLTASKMTKHRSYAEAGLNQN